MSTRHGWTVSQRLRATDSYGTLMILIFGSLVMSAAFGHARVGRLVTLAMLGLTLIFAVRTSASPRRIRHLTVVVVPLAFVLAVIADIVGIDRFADAVIAATTGLLVLAVLAAILYRLVGHPVVSGSTVLGAMCVYLLIGLLFTAIFATLAAASPPEDPFYLENGSKIDAAHANDRQLVYFSFITMTTVGYGDITMVNDLPKILSASEALIGQLYLVSVVALLVGNLGRTRRPPPPPEVRAS
jgi:hypothetical protein